MKRPPFAIYLALLSLIGTGIALSWTSPFVKAQSESAEPSEVPPPKSSTTPPLEPQAPSTAPLPAPPDATVKPLASGQYVLEFNRSPVVGNRLRLNGIYDEARLRFTRPRDWNPKSVKVSLRFRHSAALYATRSNLTVLINGTSVGSVPLNRKQGELGSAIFDIPPRLIQDYNEVVIAALQNNSPTCTQDPFDPSLWTEVLPDSKLVFNFQPQPIALNFNRYPYPIYDNLSLEPNLIAYLLPEQVEESWLTATTRLQTSIGRFAQFRGLDTRLLRSPDELKPNERLIIVGTPKTQPALASLNLPLPLKHGQFRDEKQKSLPSDAGILMMAASPDGNHPVLVATGNSLEGVKKAVQFLVQARDRQLGTGRVIIVKQVDEVPAPDPRDWPGYLPSANSFQLKDLKGFNNQPIDDVTVRGADAPVIEYDFRALPDDQFNPGNVVYLRYSYSPQVNPLNSLLEVQLDGFPLAGRRLDSENGGVRETLKVTLPEDRIKPNSKLQVRFQLDPRERRSCNRATDQQLWGTVHADSQFELKRSSQAQVPDLKLLQFGFPFAAPQDLSRTAIALPNQPTQSDLLLLLELAERLGRISRADSVKLDVYRINQVPEPQKEERHWIAIGTQPTFPLPEVFKAEDFSLQDLFSRQRDQSKLQTLPDEQGVIKQMISPWNPKRVVLALSGQTEQGLDKVRDLFSRDDLFFQLREDTVLISTNSKEPLPYDPQAYNLEFLQRARQKTASL
ncbi:cellulose biosynthesis cyclic di-GMP-binding regulatory protein BcsB [Leptothermofonsia sp. ETS-13]|uniref:cellulose biosynthesis cyclic di-GMP-binding regulatory protein BcsB n=1 Tax=Leptothermofonsia sp. ETS-13 TaxID=3035696 RepID=UPI003B9DEB9A